MKDYKYMTLTFSDLWQGSKSAPNAQFSDPASD